MIIGISGFKRSGKDTVAAVLEEKGFVKIRFADPLKEMLRAIDIPEENIEGARKDEPMAVLGGRSARYAMQTLGTEWGRNTIHPDLWVMIWARRARTHQHVVAPDVRFPNEATIIQALGGSVWHVHRTGFTGDRHESERYIDKLPCNRSLVNDGTIEELQTAARTLLALEMGIK
jgi:hypothetical protein